MNAEMLEQLLRPEAYPHHTEKVELEQTHISYVFLTPNRAYKVKRAVNLGFLDYSTLAQRLHFCNEEVRLNRRLAPEIYHGVIPITRDASGALQFGGQGPAIEYAVEMQRLPSARMMDRMLERGEIDNQQMNELASLLAGFHERAATGPGVDEYGSLENVRINCRENFQQISPFVGDLVSPKIQASLSSANEAFLEAHADLFTQRVREGRIREGHGDLHAGNICFADHRIHIYDCLEFTPRFRCSDVAAELAFLVMDLDQRHFRGFGSYLTQRYAEITGDSGLSTLLPFYKTYRALVRAKVAAFRTQAEGLQEDQIQEARAEAKRYFLLALSYQLPPVLVLMCGLPGTGKSWLAHRMLYPLEAVVLRSDVVRKTLCGIPPSEPRIEEFGQGLYSAEHTGWTYARLLEEAQAQLRRRRSVIVDATFSHAKQRSPFFEAARKLGVPCILVEVACFDSVVRSRLEQRRAEGVDPSDADERIFWRSRSAFEPPSEIPSRQHIYAVSGEPVDKLDTRLADALLQMAGA